MTPKIKTVGDLLYWAYSNLAMAHAAITDKSGDYNKKHYFIRSHLFKGLKDNSKDIRSFFDDERLKMVLPQSCCYCGSTEHLAADHIIPRKEGGLDIGENLIWACRSCNSSKSATDMLKWMQSKNIFPSILLYRRYLKILINYCRDKNLINISIEEVQKNKLPFCLSSIPQEYLPLSKMKLWVTETEEKESKKKQSTYRIANWNLERPLKESKKLELALQKIKEIDPDICILTETSKIVNLNGKYYSCHTGEYHDYPNEYWASIWSKWQISKTISTFNEKKATCALIKAPFGNIIVYASIIPYQNAGVRDGGKAEYAPRKLEAWEMHKQDIILQSADWLKIIEEYPETPLCVAGDFNQARDGSKNGYGNNEIRTLLTQTLELCNLTCITDENFGESKKLQVDPRQEKTRTNIDHICVTTSWHNTLKSRYIGAWNHFTEDGEYMTDHNGVYFEFSR